MRAYRLAYDGRPFHGFQRQPDVPTVEGTFLDAVGALGLCGPSEVPAGYAAAGRTDAGVSALAQTVAFEAPDWCSPAALNGELPAEVRSWAVAEVPGDFHATLDATRRAYEYHLYAPEGSIDDDRTRDALAALEGDHDFHNLTPDASGTVRTLAGSLVRDGSFLRIRVEAGGFDRQLVRRLVTLVRSVGTGDASLERVGRALGPDVLDGGEGVAPAPPEPLVLVDVSYPGTRFVADARAAESAREVFEHERVEALTAARVAGAIRDGIDS